jgi:surface antigen
MKFLTKKIGQIILAIISIILFSVIKPAYAQDNSVCGDVHNRSAGGAYSPVLTIWETGQYVFFSPDDNYLYEQLTTQGLPGYYRFADPVYSEDMVSMISYSTVERVTSCEPTIMPTFTSASTSTEIPISPTSTPYPTSTTIPATATPIPPTATSTIEPMGEGEIGDGYEPGLSFWEQIGQIIAPPAEAYSAADCQATFTVNNCTWHVAKTRTDICNWITPGQGNAFQWTSQAQQNGTAYGVTVNTKPKEVADIVVWSPYCAGSLENGHVALVTAIRVDGRIDISEMNWSVGGGKRTIKVEDCMRFISPPSSKPTSGTTSLSTQHPVVIPTPSVKQYNFFKWFASLFSR